MKWHATRFCDSIHLLCLDVVVLGNGTSEIAMSVAEFYVTLFRRHRLHRNEREAVWSSVDQLITLQLLAAEQNKQALHVICLLFLATKLLLLLLLRFY